MSEGKEIQDIYFIIIYLYFSVKQSWKKMEKVHKWTDTKAEKYTKNKSVYQVDKE